MDHCRCTEISLQQKNTELEELLQERLTQTEVTFSKSFSNSEELNQLQEDVNNLQVENVSKACTQKLFAYINIAPDMALFSAKEY